ncbi:dTDP-4-dehydrorhamnose 3,5-epimerase-like enzyme [Luteibacter sp. 621]|jgi:dTDP-4-dehydrorhamnose 3,5-epimerase-like enzyme
MAMSAGHGTERLRGGLRNLSRRALHSFEDHRGTPGFAMDIARIPFQIHGDSRGMLVALEGMRDVPFDIRRVYYIFATAEAVRRGQHAHRTLTQLAVAVRGSVTFLLDDGTGPAEVTLDDPASGVLIGPMVWRELHHFSEDCVVMVLADQLYDPTDYIADYEQFLQEANALTFPGVAAAWPGR